jgi:hypothetical protein
MGFSAKSCLFSSLFAYANVFSEVIVDCMARIVFPKLLAIWRVTFIGKHDLFKKMSWSFISELKIVLKVMFFLYMKHASNFTFSSFFSSKSCKPNIKEDNICKEKTYKPFRTYLVFIDWGVFNDGDCNSFTSQ